MSGPSRSKLSAVLFDMDGVITDTATAHFASWKRLFDEYLSARAGDDAFKPFSEADYRRYVDGKPRYDGARSFLESREIALPDGDGDDEPDRETICGLGNRKNRYFNDWLADNRIEPFPGTLALIDKLKASGVKIAVFSSSRNAEAVLRSAGVLDLFDARVDGRDMAELALPGKPDPAILMQALKRLDAPVEEAAVIEDASSGVEAGVRGGFSPVIGVAREGHRDELLEAGADIIVADLAELAFDPHEGLAVKTLHGLPAARDRKEELRARLIGKRPVVFLDYDGTLTPIVEDPKQAILSEGMKHAVQRLASALPTAIVSGRDLEDVRTMVGLDELFYAGSHGFAMAGPDGWREDVESGKDYLPDLDRAEIALNEALAGIEGAFVERKSFSLAIHFRRVKEADEPDVANAVSKVMARFERLRWSAGKKVFDVKPKTDWHKGRALMALLEKRGLDEPDVVPIYLGDDTTDEDAFRAISGRGIGLVVRDKHDRPTAADYALADTADVENFVKWLAEYESPERMTENPENRRINSMAANGFEGEPLVCWFAQLDRNDNARVGGKNASLGEMIGSLRERGISVPEGFATTAAAYWAFIRANELQDKIAEQIGRLKGDRSNLRQIGEAIRELILGGEFSPELAQAIKRSYAEMAERNGEKEPGVAVRSSATAEDLPEASFAGQLDSFLNVRGDEAVLAACKRCFSSLFTDRAIAYREDRGFDHLKIALSVGVQRMVRSDKASAGVMFSLDTETGFPDIVLINGNWGLGETVVQGSADPDEYHVFKPLLHRENVAPIVEKRRGAKEKKMIDARQGSSELVETSEDERGRFVLEDAEILTLARWACTIEEHYGQPMDIEWAKDGNSGEIFIVQARPETVQARKAARTLKSYRIGKKGKQLLQGISVGDAAASGKVFVVRSPSEGDKFPEGGVLATEQTDPDWVPLMKRAAAIVTEKGGRTSHAAIVSRELGLPAVIGTGNATKVLKEKQEVTVSCAEGNEGFVYEGAADIEVEDVDLRSIPETDTDVMVNLANPAAAFSWWRLPTDGVGLARMEFVISNHIRIHPMALAHFDKVEDEKARKEIEELTKGYKDKPEYFIDKLARGVARIAAAHHPNPVIVRMSDFKTNEYAELIGGRQFEPKEANPMLGWRGASRYYDEGYRDGFALECRAIVRAREEIGLDNVIVMVPFCRTLEEADRVLGVMAEHGLMRGQAGLQIYVMAEIPANIILAPDFANRFDGFSIGSNDLTQLTLGIDRDSDKLRKLFDERDPAVARLISSLIRDAHAHQTKVGFCGQVPSDHPEYARFLVEQHIDSVSVSPDSFLRVKRHVAEAERHAADRRG